VGSYVSSFVEMTQHLDRFAHATAISRKPSAVPPSQSSVRERIIITTENGAVLNQVIALIHVSRQSVIINWIEPAR
jgi:hypothetical protein